MRKKTISSVISFVTALCVLAVCAFAVYIPVSAARASTLVSLAFEENIQHLGDDEYYYYSGGGYNCHTWQVFTTERNTAVSGFDASYGAVLKVIINDAAYPTSCTANATAPIFSWGQRLLYTSNNRWNTYTRDLTEYTNTGSVAATIKVTDATFLDHLLLILGDLADGSNVVGVRVSDYYTAEDLGTAKTISIPLSRFVNGGEGVYSYAETGSSRLLNLSKYHIAGFGLYEPEAVTEKVTFYYDNMVISNVAAATDLTVSESNQSGATLEWRASESDVAGYVVMRDGEKIADVTGTQYEDNTLTLGSTYTYAVYAVDKYGAYSVASNKVEVYASDVGVPQNVRALSSFDELKTVLTWDAPAYGTPREYEIYRDGTLIGKADGNELTYTDNSDLTEDTYHIYYVIAVGAELKSMKSESVRVFVTFLGFPENVSVDIEGEDIRLTWGEVKTAANYKIYRNGVVIATVEECEYTDTDWSYSTAYTYYVTAVNSNGRESAPSEKIITVKNEPDKMIAPIYEDSIIDDRFSFAAVGSCRFENGNEKVAAGERSLKLRLAPGSYNTEGAALVLDRETDFSTMRASGARLEFLIYAENADMLKDVKLGLTCPTDRLNNVVYTAYSGIDISDYTTRYGYWSYVSIPISAFPVAGYYTADSTSKRVQSFKFGNVTGIAVYTDEAHYMVDKQIYIDDIKFTSYIQPMIAEVTDVNGTVVDYNSEISAATKLLNVKFDAELEEDTLAGNVTLKSATGSFPVECAYNNKSKTVTVSFSAGLQKSGVYTLSFDGVRSVKGSTLTGVAFDFSTNDDEADEAYSMNDTEYVEYSSRSIQKGKDATVSLKLASQAAHKTAIESMDVTISYDPAILSTSAAKVAMTGSLKDAIVTVNSKTGTVNIKIESTDTGQTYVIGSYIANITFSALKAGGSAVTVSGTLEQADPKKSVTVTQSGIPQISVTTAPTGGTGGSSGGGSSGGLRSGMNAEIGGGRDEATTVTPGVEYTDASSQQAASSSGFNDLADVPWAVEAIEKLEKSGIVTGFGDGTYRPNDDVTREQFVAIFMRLFVTSFDQYIENAEMDFADMDVAEWYYPYVAAAFQMGIVQGSEGRFGIGETITREDMCTMLARAAAVYGVSLEPSYNMILFSDRNEISDYAAGSVTQLQQAGLINGIGDNMFAPKDNVTRAMAVKVIYELQKLK